MVAKGGGKEVQKIWAASREHHTRGWEGDSSSVCGPSEIQTRTLFAELRWSGWELSAFASSERVEQESQSLNHPVD